MLLDSARQHFSLKARFVPTTANRIMEPLRRIAGAMQVQIGRRKLSYNWGKRHDLALLIASFQMGHRTRALALPVEAALSNPESVVYKALVRRFILLPIQ